MPQMRHRRATLLATGGGMSFDGDELSSAWLRAVGFMLVPHTQQMRILLLFVTVLRVVVSGLSTRADIAKSEGKTTTQSLGTYNAWGFEEDLSQKSTGGCTSRRTWAREASKQPSEKDDRGGWCMEVRSARGAFFHCAYDASQGAIERTWPYWCVYGYKQTCVRSVDIWCSEMQ